MVLYVVFEINGREVTVAFRHDDHLEQVENNSWMDIIQRLPSSYGVIDEESEIIIHNMREEVFDENTDLLIDLC
jgi:hypothetical protein